MKIIYTIMFWFSAVLMLAAIFVVFMYGLNLGIDFRGGSVMELEFHQAVDGERLQSSSTRPQSSLTRPAINDVRDVLTEAGLGGTTVNYTGDSGIILRTKALSEDEHQNILTILRSFFTFEEKKFDSIGPVIGNELKNKSITAMLFVLLAVIVYIALVFRKLSKTLSPWVMGFAAIVALLHDVVIPIGIFAALGRFYGIEISAVFVAAVLTILGYSVADTVVVFDRIRENIIRDNSRSFPEVVHKSVLQTLTRSLNTTFTTLLSLFAIFFFGGESIRYFALALMIGIFLGAYSSIFVASPLTVWLSKKK